MRPRLIFTAIVALLVVMAASYYFYGYRNRSLSDDISSVRGSTADAATTTAVKTALALNSRVSAFDIQVETSNNNVTLTGQVPTPDDKRAAEEIARGTKGVATVINNLHADPKIQAANAEKQYISDTEIKAAVLESILNNADLKIQQIKVGVSNGVVKLTGRVQTTAQKSMADALVRATAKVRYTDTEALVVTEPGPATQLQSQNQIDDTRLTTTIEALLGRETALSQPQKIKVSARAGSIYLTGMAGSRAERALAEQLARSVLGTRDVINNLEVPGQK